jgi:hypothetical protein
LDARADDAFGYCTHLIEELLRADTNPGTTAMDGQGNPMGVLGRGFDGVVG